MSQELESLGKALFHCRLQGVVIVGGVAAKIVDLLCPAEFLKEWFSLISRQSTEPDDADLIGIIVGDIACEHVSTLIGYIADLQRKRRRDRLLQGDIPSVERGQPHFGWQHVGTHLVGKAELSRRRNRRESGRWRSLRKVEHAPGECRRVELLLHQNRQVLRNRVPKYRAEYPNVKAPPISQPNHRFGRSLISDAQARRQVSKVVLHISLQVDVAITSDTDQPSVEIYPPTCSLSSDRLRRVNLPPQSVVECQPASDAVSILAVEEPALLTFSCVVSLVYIPAENAHVAKQERSQTQATPTGPLGSRIKKN